MAMDDDKGATRFEDDGDGEGVEQGDDCNRG